MNSRRDEVISSVAYRSRMGIHAKDDDNNTAYAVFCLVKILVGASTPPSGFATGPLDFPEDPAYFVLSAAERLGRSLHT